MKRSSSRACCRSGLKRYRSSCLGMPLPGWRREGSPQGGPSCVPVANGIERRESKMVVLTYEIQPPRHPAGRAARRSLERFWRSLARPRSRNRCGCGVTVGTVYRYSLKEALFDHAIYRQSTSRSRGKVFRSLRVEHRPRGRHRCCAGGRNSCASRDPGRRWYSLSGKTRVSLVQLRSM